MANDEMSEALRAQQSDQPVHDDNCSMVRISGCDVCDCGAIRPVINVMEHDLLCMLIQNEKATACTCGGPWPKKEELVRHEYTLVASQNEENLFYIRAGDGSHSSQDVASIHFTKDETSEEGTDLLLFLAMHMKVK